MSSLGVKCPAGMRGQPWELGIRLGEVPEFRGQGQVVPESCVNRACEVGRDTGDGGVVGC